MSICPSAVLCLHSYLFTHICMHARAGMWTKPPNLIGNKFFEPNSRLPPIEKLAASLPMGLNPLEPAPVQFGSHMRAHTSTTALQRICATFQQHAWAPTACEYYFIGNTYGYDVTCSLAPNTDSDTVRILLGACGDIRNLLATVHGMRTKQGATSAVHVVMNDGNTTMLARNAALIYMAAELHADAQDCLSVWADHVLSTGCNSMLQLAITCLAKDPWPTWLTCAMSLDGSRAQAAEEQLRGVFDAWSNSDMTVELLLSNREMVLSSDTLRADAVRLSLDEMRGNMNNDRRVSAWEGEITKYIHTGSLQGGGDTPNVTALLAPTLQYTVYFSSSIYRAVSLADKMPKSGAEGAGGDVRVCVCVCVCMCVSLMLQIECVLFFVHIQSCVFG